MQQHPRSTGQAFERATFTSPNVSVRSSSTLRHEHELDHTPISSQSYRTPPATQYHGSPSVHGTPGPESIGGSDSKLPEYMPIIKHARELLGRYTLLEEPWPQPDSLMVNIRRFWAEASDHFNTSLNLTKSAGTDVSSFKAFHKAQAALAYATRFKSYLHE
jgi:hypothetical protein